MRFWFLGFRVLGRTGLKWEMDCDWDRAERALDFFFGEAGGGGGGQTPLTP